MRAMASRLRSKRTVVGVAAALLLPGCTTPQAPVRAGLINAGIDQRTATCMADRMVHRLSLLQLRRMAGLGKAEHSRDLDQLLYRLRSLNDPEIVTVTASSAALCKLGLG
ncbi:MAG: hypothetical protein JWM65_1226 [Sphingomonas bacterium]|nr:hypothetical protein [Sphingomonas bacterium]